MISILLLGLLLGMKHALEADHVAALATLATRAQSLGQTVKLGAAWGLGHTLTLLLFGGLVLALDMVMPERLAQGLDLAVGIMLLLLGLDVLRRVVRIASLSGIGGLAHEREREVHQKGMQREPECNPWQPHRSVSIFFQETSHRVRFSGYDAGVFLGADDGLFFPSLVVSAATVLVNSSPL